MFKDKNELKLELNIIRISNNSLLLKKNFKMAEGKNSIQKSA